MLISNFYIFTLQDKLRTYLEVVNWFEVNSHESKICIPFFSFIESIKSFGSGGLKQGLSDNRKHIFFGLKRN